MWRVGLLIAAVVAGTIGAVVSQQTSAQTELGQPLTKDEYFQLSIHFSAEEGKSERLYYRFAVNPLKQRKCASLTRHYHQRLVEIVDEASQYVPPPEIATLHQDLISTSRQVIDRIGAIARRAHAGKITCGESLGANRDSAANKIYRTFSRSRFDEIQEQLRDLGYLPSGE